MKNFKIKILDPLKQNKPNTQKKLFLWSNMI